jgi:hypothetical protein
MTDVRPGTNTQAQFFNAKNEAMLDRLLNADFQRRIGGDLNDKQQKRLVKTVKHYMTEVYAKSPNQSIQYLNKEVLQSVVPDYLSYLKRSSAPVSDEEGEPALRMDVSSRFGKLQSERQGPAVAAPVAPDFRINMDSDGPSPLSRFEEIKKIREAEAAREAETAAAMNASRATLPSQEIVASPSMKRFVNSDIDFSNGAEAARQRDQLSLIMREAERAASRTEIVGQPRALPDPRAVLLGEGGQIPVPARSQGIASGNPTLAIADSYRERALPQDVIKPQDDIVSYKEAEHNLFVYSADRDWANNTTESRYSFSVNFDPANNQSGFGYNTATNIKFKNITRVELVKVIMPTEGIDTLLQSTANAVSGTVEPTMNTDLNVNVFTYPYLQVRIPELNTNGYGTNDGLNNSFGVISYDAYWASDSNTKGRGFARMIPKFLKCQKVFYPTPLSTLQKLTFQIQRPDGNLVSNTMDTLDVSGVYFSSTPAFAATKYFDASGIFFWISTKAYFSKFAFSQGDRINFKNVDFSTTFKTAAGAGATTDFTSFLNRADGHLICDIGRVETISAALAFRDGANVAGYANAIIIRGSFGDPTTGSTSLRNFGGSSTTNTTFKNQLGTTPSVTAGRLINMNHQIQVILRVITREMDSAAKLRPDNLQA